MRFSEALLEWYDREARVLPWRGERDPYRIWLSEIMLQQTQVETVRGYYARFLAEFPDVHALAAAEEDRVLKLWEGLGYYSRARNLLKAARIVSLEYGGRFPDTPEGLRALPGIGPYAAGAIASIAFGVCAPALDGNQARVLSRLTAYSKPLRTPFDLESVAAEYMSRERPGDYNQALMDLASLICTPRRALCEKCPGAPWCEARSEGCPEAYPIREKPATKRIEALTVLLVKVGGGVAVYRRPPKGLLGGLYAFPSVEGHPSGAEIEAYMASNGWKNPAFVRALPEASHTFTHLVWNMRGAMMTADGAPKGFSIIRDTRDVALPAAFKVYRSIADDILESTGTPAKPNDRRDKS